jgi:hypothetical protein
VITLAAQPAEKRAFEQFRVKPVGAPAAILKVAAALIFGIPKSVGK